VSLLFNVKHQYEYELKSLKIDDILSHNGAQRKIGDNIAPPQEEV